MKVLFPHTYYPKYSDNRFNTALLKTNNANSYAQNSSAIAFASLKNFPANLYFVRMTRYKKDAFWNGKMCKATEMLSSMMQKDMDIKLIIHMAEHFVSVINRHGKVKNMFGIRKKIPGGVIDLLNDSQSRGHEYLSRYKELLNKSGFFSPKSNQTYNEAITCNIMTQASSAVIHTGQNNPAKINTNLTLVEKAYKALKGKKSPTKKEIVDTAATIQWLIAQETPYMRGSDSMANLLTRSLLNSYGIELSPLKAGVSCDFEAFYRNLDDYIKIYPTLFEKNLMS